MSRRARIEIVPSSRLHRQDGHFLRLRASNGRVLAHSEVYASKSNAKRAADAWLVAMYDCVRHGDFHEVTE